jgi:hypothetical protein
MTSANSDLFQLSNAMRSASAIPSTLALSMLLSLGACGGGGDGTSAPSLPGDPGQDTYQNVLFERRHADGSSDLYRAPVDGSAPPIAITNHGQRTIDEILNPDALVAGRVVYLSRSSSLASDDNFFSVGTEAGSTPLQLTHFDAGGIITDSYRLVGSTLLFRAFSGLSTTDLWAVPVDGSTPARNLTNLSMFDSVGWETDQVFGTRIFFEVQRMGSGARQHYVFDASGSGAPVLLGPTSDRLYLLENTTTLELAPATESRYAASGNTLFLRGERNLGSTFQLLAADVVTGSLRAISDSFPVAAGSANGVEKVTGGFVVDNRFCYFVDSHLSGRMDLYAAGFGTGASSYSNLTSFLAGSNNTVKWKAFVPSQPKVVVANETPAFGSMVVTDLYVVDVSQGTKVRILDGSILGPTPASSDMGKVMVLGNVTLFERIRELPRLWSAALDGSAPAGTEVLANVTDSKGLDGFVISSAGAGRTEAFGDDPTFDFTNLAVETAFAYVTRYSDGTSYSDLYLLSGAGTSVQTLRLTAQSLYPDGPIFRHPMIFSLKAGRIVYVRDLEWFSCPIHGNGTEARITNNFSGVGTLALDRVYYMGTDANLYSSPYTDDVSAGQIRAITAFPMGSAKSPVGIHPNGGSVVFEIQSGSRRQIFSSPVAPAAPNLTDLSRDASTFDDALLLF